jgi:hypothetical protein
MNEQDMPLAAAQQTRSHFATPQPRAMSVYELIRQGKSGFRSFAHATILHFYLPIEVEWGIVSEICPVKLVS